jgi:hypothetical protein
MEWVILVVAGLLEVGWAIGLKYTAGFTRLWPTVFTILAMIISLWLLGIAMKRFRSARLKPGILQKGAARMIAPARNLLLFNLQMS